MFKKISIKYKIILIIELISFVIVGIAIVIFFIHDLRKFKNEAKENALVQAKLIGDDCVMPLYLDYPDRAKEVLKKLNVVKEVIRAEVYKPNGQLYANYLREDISNEELFNRSLITEDLEYRRESYFESGNLFVKEPIVYKGETYGVLAMQTDLEIQKEVQSMLLNFVLIMVLLLLLTYLLASVLHKYISSPILKLASFAENISSEKDYSQRIHSMMEDEIGELYKQFNLMLGEIESHNAERDKVQVELNTLNEELEERVKKRTLELEYLNNELQDFAYITSHDLKSPLRGISQITQWLMNDYKEKLDDNGKELMMLLNERVVRMNKLIENILEYSRIGRKEDDKREIDLVKVLNEVVGLLDVPSEVKLIIPEDLPKIKGNTTRYEQLFLNLVGNAIKYAPDVDGLVEVSWEEIGDWYQFCVSDNGVGISEKYHKKIFAMFQTLNESTNNTSTGVGLAIVKKIVDLYRGKIWVESEENKGAKFYFTLPK